MGLFDTTVKVFEKVIPPGDGADPEHVQNWRLWIAIFTGVNMLGLAMHVILACGLTPFFAGFALASEQKASAAQIGQILENQVGQQIFNLKVQQCIALKEGKSGLVYAQQIDEKQREYVKLTGREKVLPSCDEL